MGGKDLTFLKGVATGKEFINFLKAINISKRNHSGQFRRTGEEYITHPTRVASELWALGIRNDIILATAMLHDVLEDCPITKSQLLHDFGLSEEVVKHVELLTKVKGESTEAYYTRIKQSPEAILVKISDRCHNISTLNGAFSLEKMKKYVEETEQFVIPLCKYGKEYYPEYSDKIFVMKYHIESMTQAVSSFIHIIENKEVTIQQ